ncbi:MAG: hypothetical protein HDQ96_05175 [Lachnospiraceae bacterium]|nr:hypothetical protein [Lachnospiraceae bacterium]
MEFEQECFKERFFEENKFGDIMIIIGRKRCAMKLNEHKGHDYCFYLEEKNWHSFGPKGWEVRKSCWNKAEEILRENGDI